MHTTPDSTYEFISKEYQEPIIHRQVCSCCTAKFPIFKGDIELLQKLYPTISNQKVELPLPQECWHCRERNRLMFRNDSHFYHAICEKSGEKTISRINPKRGYHIYTNEARSGDDRDKCEHGVEFDFSKTFTEQYKDLLRKTPFQNLIGSYSNIKNNAVYTNYTADISDSYLVFESDGITQSCYCTSCRKSNYLFDCFSCTNCEYCYECTFSKNLHSCLYCESCSDCNRCVWSTSCIGCNDCIGCVNLTGKQYYIFNKQYTKEEYENFLQILKSAYYNISHYSEYQQLIQQSPKSATTLINSEHSLGDTIFFSNDVRYSYDIANAQSVRYCYDVSYCSDLMDVSSYGSESSLMYYSQGVGRYSNHLYFCITIGRGENLMYCIDTKKSSDCFACVNIEGLKHTILNKQYNSKEEYEAQVTKIITHMQETGERGLFFDPSISPFPYNDTVANDYYPPAIIQTKEGTIISKNPTGRGTLTIESPDEELSKATISYGGSTIIHTTRRTKETEVTLPEHFITTKISDIDPSDYYNVDLLKEKILVCESSNRPFKLQKSEIEFYQKFGLSIPHLHPEIRHQQRVRRKPGRHLYINLCDKTKLPTISVYDETSGYTIYSNEAYRQEVYG